MNKKIVISIAFFVIVVISYHVLGDTHDTKKSERTNDVKACGIAVKPKTPFDIPSSLIHRMTKACDAALIRRLGIKIDKEELFASDCDGKILTNAYQIAIRPRDEMKFCNDLLSEKERERLWPFDIEELERSLEMRMTRDKDGLYRLRKMIEHTSTSTNNQELIAPIPTFRFINHEIEKWAITQLDSKYERIDEKSFCDLLGTEKNPTGEFAWMLSNKLEYFIIQRCDGAWNSRVYRYVIKGEDMKRPVPVASFDSFPSRKEASAMRTYGRNPAAMNNLAVLEWKHRSHRLSMIPMRIKWLLEFASAEGVKQASENLIILRNHIPEIFNNGN